MTNNNYHMEGRISTDQHATEWMTRHLSGQMTHDEAERFELWLQEPENREAYNRLAHAAGSADVFGEELLAQNFAEELEALSQEHQRRHKAWPAVAAIAATLLAAVMTGLFVLTPQEPETLRYATLIGHREAVPLEDGSMITLNTATQLDVTYAPDIRDVTLTSGEAYFSVARDPERVFSVRTAHGTITVTGTSFNVRTLGEETSVSVISGAVEVELTGLDRVTLLSGEAVSFDAGTRLLEKTVFDATQVLSWRTGRVIFEDTPLTDVVEELNRYFQTPLVLAARAPGDAPVTGEFDITDQLTAVRGLSVALSLGVTREPDRILLTPAEEEEE